MKRTKLSTCARKRRFPSEDEAVSAIVADGIALRPYRCDRCGHFHLTSRTKGKPPPRRDVVPMHPICQQTLLANPAAQKFVEWVAKKDPDFTTSTAKKER